MKAEIFKIGNKYCIKYSDDTTIPPTKICTERSAKLNTLVKRARRLNAKSILINF